MADSEPVSVLCIYRVKDGKADEFRALLEKHWTTLASVGLVSEEPARWYVAESKQQKKCFIEMFQWKDAKASDTAHELPEVMAIWEPMGTLTDDMEFFDIERLG